MRHTLNPQVDLGSIPLNPKSRDYIPGGWLGLQSLTRNQTQCAQLEQGVLSGVDRKTGRPGIDLWRIGVMATIRQGLGCDWDRLRERGNEHRTIWTCPGHGSGGMEYRRL